MLAPWSLCNYNYFWGHQYCSSFIWFIQEEEIPEIYVHFSVCWDMGEGWWSISYFHLQTNLFYFILFCVCVKYCRHICNIYVSWNCLKTCLSYARYLYFKNLQLNFSVLNRKIYQFNIIHWLCTLNGMQDTSISLLVWLQWEETFSWESLY